MFGFFEKAPAGDRSKNVFLDIDENLKSNVDGMYIVGDLSGLPLIKNAMNQGTEIVDKLAPELQKATAPEGVYDLVIVGAGAAGISSALRAKEKGLSYIVLEQGKIANTIANFPDMKLIFDEPVGLPAKGSLYVAETTKEDLLDKWMDTVAENNLNIHAMEPVTNIRREKQDRMVVETPKATYVGKRVLLAIGKRGNPRRLGVPGEDLGKVMTELHNPEKFHDKNIVVVGGGDSGAETALALSKQNKVVYAVQGEELNRPKKANIEKVMAAAESGKLDLRLKSKIKSIEKDKVVLDENGTTVELPNDYVFPMIGADPPLPFLRKLGIRVKGEWTSKRVVFFTVFMLLCTLIYVGLYYPNVLPQGLLKNIPPPHIVYGGLYCICVGAFGLHALLKPRPRQVRYTWYTKLRTASSMFFQIGVYFLLPVFILPLFGQKDVPVTTLFHFWPLSPKVLSPETFTKTPWLFWAGLAGSFVVLPVFVYFFGKRYCSFVCGCGALAETLGDSTRDLSPKGELNRKREMIVYAVLIWVTLGTIYAWVAPKLFAGKAPGPLDFVFGTAYGFVIQWFWSGVLGVGAYFAFGNRIWCRFGCPLAILMNLYGKVGLKSRFKITSNDKCIDCGQCNRYCQMGIDVKKFALSQKPLTLMDTPCIGCGECIAVCPMDVLKLGDQPTGVSGKDGIIRGIPIIEKH